jgi:hypothetical protein
MNQPIQTLIHLLSQDDDKALLQHYLASTEADNIVQLGYIFQQAMKQLSTLDFYQQLASKLIASKNIPARLIAKINTSDALSFFTPALQLKDNFKSIDHQKRNVLHYLLAGNQLVVNQPPFNYLRSMMLFESNETLRGALYQRDNQNLTPIEVYLFANKNLVCLPPHELTALLALIEIESKLQEIETSNYQQNIQAVAQICRSQVMLMNSELQRLILIAIYFKKSINDVVADLK